MKRENMVLLEAISYLVLMTYAFNCFPGYFEGVRVTTVFLIPMLAIAVVNMLQVFMEKKMETKIIAKYDLHGKWIYRVIVITLITLVFFGVCILLEDIGNMPGTLRTLLFISVLASTAFFMCEEFLKFLTTSEESSFWEDDEFENQLKKMMDE